MIRSLIILLLCAAAAAQEPHTPMLGLFVPNTGNSSWSGELDANFQIIDNVAGKSPQGLPSAIQSVQFVTLGLVIDGATYVFNGVPGGLAFTTANLDADVSLYQHDPTVPNDYDWVSLDSYGNNLNGLTFAGATLWVWDGELGYGHNGFGCPGSSDRLHGGWSMYEVNTTGNGSAADGCGDTTGSWFDGPVTITGPVIIQSTTYANLIAKNYCNGTANPVTGVFSEGSRATVTDSTTNVAGAVISGGGSFHVGAYCSGSTWVVDSTPLSPNSNCAAVGTTASPSVASCTAAQSGSVSCSPNASTGICTVNTTQVANTSEIIVRQRADAATGTRLGVTCNATKDSNSTAPQITAVSAGVSFSFQLGTISTNPECFSFLIAN